MNTSSKLKKGKTPEEIADAYIMADGGWCSDNVLKSVYRHAMSDKQKEMSAKANSHFESLF